eukprot:GFYU01039672.1.p1 GENE.GFYU01039672.1~~GFYU01039672.1.p1  ORF type:complete len:167 (-),score=62.04 GFYU01039672.1:128-628(-)
MQTELVTLPTPTLEEVEARMREGRVYTFFGMQQWLNHQQVKPYPVDQYFNTTATNLQHTKVMFLQGDMDPQTPHISAMSAFDGLGATHKQFVTVPGAAHFTLKQIPGGLGLNKCTLKIFTEFLAGDGENVDTSCLAEMGLVSYKIPAGAAARLFGTPDAYDGTPAE